MSDAGTTAVRAINISEVLRGIARRWKMLLAFTLGFAGLGLLFIMTATPLYTSETQILIEYQDSPYTRTPVTSAQPPRQIAESDVRSQVAVLKSRDLALKVLRRLKLVGTPEFDILKKGIGPLRRLKIFLGFAADPRRQTPEQRALEVWYRHLRVYNVPRTKIIVVEFDSTKPETAAAVANALADAYVEQTRNSQLERTGEARQWLKDQIEKLRKKVVESEVAVERFRAEAGLLRGTRSTLYSQQLSELNSQLVRAQAERSKAQARARAIRDMLKGGSLETSAEVLRSPLIQRLREQQVRLQRKMAELSTVYLDNHPKVRAVRQELRNLDRQIRAEARKIVASLEQQAKIAAEREAELRVALAKLKSKASDASVNEVRLRELEREARANRALLESFLARYTDATARDEAAALPGMARVISRADVPAMPSFPRKGPVMFLSTLAGLMLGLGIAFIIEVMAASSRLAGQLRTEPSGMQGAGEALGVSGSVAAGESGLSAVDAGDSSSFSGRRRDVGPEPHVKTAPDVRDAAVDGKSGADEVFEEVADSGGASGRPSGVPTFRVAVPGLAKPSEAPALAMAPVADDDSRYSRSLSPVMDWIGRCREAGRTRLGVVAEGEVVMDAVAAAVALARLGAGRGWRTVVVDTGSGDGRLAQVTGMKDVQGISDLLAGRAGFQDIVHRDLLSSAHFIHAGHSAGEDGGSSSAGALGAVLEALARTYDLVILLHGDASAAGEEVLSSCDMALLAAPEGAEDAVAAMVEMLRKAGVSELFLLEVRAAERSAAAAFAGGVRMTAGDAGSMAAL